jgi:hypothetical protein
VIARLREIRQLRDQRAEEAVLHHQAATRKAEMLTQAASKAIVEQREQTAGKERSAFGSLVGQSVSIADLHRVRSQCEKAAMEAVQLCESEKAACSEEEERKAELSEARKTHRIHLKAVSKLDRLADHLEMRTVRRRVALEELSDEEGHRSLARQ